MPRSTNDSILRTNEASQALRLAVGAGGDFSDHFSAVGHLIRSEDLMDEYVVAKTGLDRAVAWLERLSNEVDRPTRS